MNGNYLALNFEDFDFDAAPSHLVEEKLQRMGGLLVDNWRWVWESSIQDSLDHATGLLDMQKDIT